MKKRFYEKAVACLLGVMLTVASVVPVGAQGTNLENQTESYSTESIAEFGKAVSQYGIWDKMEGTLGDATGDGKVTLQDAKTLLQFALGLHSISEEQKKLNDINGDGVVNLQDVQFVLKGALKIIPNLEEIYNMKQLVRYFEENIEPNQDGDYTLIVDEKIGSDNREILIIYYPKENCFEFVEMSVITYDINKTEYITVTFKYDVSSLSAVNHKIYFAGTSYNRNREYNEEAEADFDSGTYRLKDLPYETTVLEGQPWQPTYDHANTMTKFAFSNWNTVLEKTCKIKLKDIGFRSFPY